MVATARTISEGNEASLSDPPQRLETLQDARTIRLTLGIFQYYSVGGRLGLLPLTENKVLRNRLKGIH